MSEREDYFWGFITGVPDRGRLQARLVLPEGNLVAGGLPGAVTRRRYHRSGQRNSKPEITAGFGQYSEDHQRWQDEASGQWYPCSPVDREYCQIQASDCGFYWRKTALTRFMRRGELVRYRFSAITESSWGDDV